MMAGSRRRAGALVFVAVLASLVACEQSAPAFPEGTSVTFPGRARVEQDRVDLDSAPATRVLIRSRLHRQGDATLVLMASEQVMLFRGDEATADAPAAVADRLLLAWDEGRVMPQFGLLDNRDFPTPAGRGREAFLDAGEDRVRARFLLNERPDAALVVATVMIIGPPSLLRGGLADAFLDSFAFRSLPPNLSLQSIAGP
jgi:hypothetical protein